MSFYTKIKIVLVIILSVIVSFFTYKYLKNLKNDTTIIMATQDIDAHTMIKPEMIKEVEISKRDKETVEKGAFTTREELANAISNIKIKKGKAIIKNDDVISGTKEELIGKNVMFENGEINAAYFISDNKRITTIALDLEGAVGNKLNKGDSVDVIFTHTGDGRGSFSTIIMQHIEIYDIENASSVKNISLIVTPQQAVDITYAKRQGKVDLALDSSRGNSQTRYTSSINKFLGVDNSKVSENKYKDDIRSDKLDKDESEIDSNTPEENSNKQDGVTSELDTDIISNDKEQLNNDDSKTNDSQVSTKDNGSLG